MKGIISIVLVLLLTVSCLAQKKRMCDGFFIIQDDSSHKPLASFNKDTAAYLAYNFVQHKEKYVNKPFSVLMNDLEFPIMTFMAGDFSINKFVYVDLSIFSYDHNKTFIRRQLDLKPFDLIIMWATPIKKDTARAIIVKGGGHWSQESSDYFGKLIVGDVLRTEYQYPRDKDEY